MRRWISVAALAAVAVTPAPVIAQDAEALRKELEQMRRQFETMKDNYEKSINDLSERLKKIEAVPAPTAGAPAPAAPAAPAVSQAPPGTPAPAPPTGATSLMDLVRPRQPFALYERRGPGQLLFDIGVAGDFVGNVTQANVEQAAGGTFPGLENYFFPREIELSIFGQIDPYARGEVVIEAEQEERGGELGVNLSEANLTLLTLPFNTQAKLGKMRNRFGLLNQLHDHDLPFIDRPDALVQFLGQEGLVEAGGEATWVPPLPFYTEILGGLFNGDNETAFGYGRINHPLVTGRVRTFFELGDLGAVQLGMSVANGLQSDRLNNLILGWDAKYKLTPDGWQHPLVTAGGELLYQMRKVKTETELVTEVVDPETGEVTESTEIVSQKQTLNRVGWYLFGELRPFRFGWLSGLSAGVRYDWTQYPTNPGHQWAVGPYITYRPSEFLRFRVGYKHTEGNTPGCCSNTGIGSARIKDEFFFQSTFVLGAHPAHPF
jgi:hypothetical protein